MLFFLVSCTGGHDINVILFVNSVNIPRLIHLMSNKCPASGDKSPPLTLRRRVNPSAGRYKSMAMSPTHVN